MEQRKELVRESHDLPSRYWEPEPPEGWVNPDLDEILEEEEPPFE